MINADSILIEIEKRKKDEYLFKNREEVDVFFKDVTFQFHFRSDGTFYYNSIRPIEIEDEYLDVSIAFYDNELADVFNFSTTTEWLERFKLSEIVFIRSNGERKVVFFQKFND